MSRRWEFTVWEGDPAGTAWGRGYRWRWQAIIAAWWAKPFAWQEVWIERYRPSGQHKRSEK